MERLKAVVGFSGNLLAFIFNQVSSRELEANYGWLGLKDWRYKGRVIWGFNSHLICEEQFSHNAV
jgi:hypothetical protein